MLTAPALLATALFATTVLAPAAASAPAESQPELAAASDWLALVDAGRWDESWRGAGALFRAQMPQSMWSTAIAPVRIPLGKALSRTPLRTTRTRSLPGAPDGDYIVIEFQTRFFHKPEAVETLVLSRESGGLKVDGYFIR